jgi:quercetin dioxygenase-like cupin family protein
LTTPGDVTDLQALADELLQAADDRAARTLPHPIDGLRHTVIALKAGAVLQEHESPGSASVLVLRGRARLVAGDDTVTLAANQTCPIPGRRHSLEADEDTVVLLSVAHSHAAGHPAG